MIFSGHFGGGKSHTLAGFANEAIQSGYVVSRAVISKNLPLSSDMQLLFRLLQETKALGYTHDAFGQMLARAQSEHRLTGMIEWARLETKSGHLESVFPNSLAAFQGLKAGSENFETIVDYWAGSSLVTATRLKNAIWAGSWSRPAFNTPVAAERCTQTVRFLSRLFQELGFRGWIVMFDELELMRTLGPVSRAKSYAWLAFWLGLSSRERVPGLGAVGAFTPGYFQETIAENNPWGKQDEVWLPPKLEQTPANSRHVANCRVAMRFIGENEHVLLHPTTKKRLEDIQRSVLSEYLIAYGTNVELIPFSFYEAKSIRAYLREWITRWDLQRQGRSVEVDEYEVSPDTDSQEEDDD